MGRLAGATAASGCLALKLPANTAGRGGGEGGGKRQREKDRRREGRRKKEIETENSKERHREKQRAVRCALNKTHKALGIKVYVWRGAVIKVEMSPVYFLK